MTWFENPPGATCIAIRSQSPFLPDTSKFRSQSRFCDMGVWTTRLLAAGEDHNAIGRDDYGRRCPEAVHGRSSCKNTARIA
jgi:hypothetical protein